MHMADALLSPVVGATMWVATAATITFCSKKINPQADHGQVPMMGVMAAFVFAAQMINFTIPGTGSSGHLGGGMILAILLGPEAAFLAMASVLTVQALFFADGGILALGCNIFNLGIFPCFIAYPFIYKKIVGNHTTGGRRATGAIIAAIIALQLGSLGVVTETVLSGISALPFKTFLLAMQPIHLAIGLVEGIVTAGVVNFIIKADPAILHTNNKQPSISTHGKQRVLALVLCASLVTGGFISWFASTNPDGLEWSVASITGQEEPSQSASIYEKLGDLQEKIAIFPDYKFQPLANNNGKTATTADISASIAGIGGIAMTIMLILGLGFMLRMYSRCEMRDAKHEM